MSNTKTKKRIIYLDFLRFFAILGVVLNHVSRNWTGYGLNVFIAKGFNCFGRIGVPVFLMLTGVLLLNNKLPIKDFIKRRYPRVIIPYLFWLILLILFKLFVLEPTLLSGNIPKYLISFVSEKYWYVWLILGIYLVIPIFASFVKGSKMEGVKYFVIIWFATTALLSLSTLFNFNLHYLDLVIYSGPIGYVMLGYYLHNREINISPKKVVTICLVAFILLTLVKTLVFYHDTTFFYSFRYYIFTRKSSLEIDTVTILQVAALFLTVKYLPMVKGGICEKVTAFCNKKRILMLIISISQASYGIYLCHYFSLLSIAKILEINHMTYNDLSSIIVVPVLTIGIMFVSYALMIILNKVPVINKLTGYH